MLSIQERMHNVKEAQIDALRKMEYEAWEQELEVKRKIHMEKFKDHPYCEMLLHIPLFVSSYVSSGIIYVDIDD